MGAAMLVHHDAVLLPQLTTRCGQKVSLSPFVKRPMGEKPVVAAVDGLYFAALGHMPKFVHIKVDVLGRLLEAHHLPGHRATLYQKFAVFGHLASGIWYTTQS